MNLWYHISGASGKEPACQFKRCKQRQVWSLGQEDTLEEGMATHSSIFAWRIPWTEEPGQLQYIGSQRVGHDWSNLAHMHIYLLRFPLDSFCFHFFVKFHEHCPPFPLDPIHINHFKHPYMMVPTSGSSLSLVYCSFNRCFFFFPCYLICWYIFDWILDIVIEQQRLRKLVFSHRNGRLDQLS